jgi:hypothetical protein
MVRVKLKEKKFGNAHFEDTFIGMQMMKEFETDVEHGDGIG